MLRLSSRKLIILVLVVFFLSLYAIPFFKIREIQPDLWILLVLFYAFRVDYKRAPLFSLGIGLLKDILSTRFFGLEIFSLGMVTILLSYVLGKIERDEPVNLIVSAVVYSLLYEMLACAGFVFLNGSYDLLPEFLARSCWRSFYTVVSFPLAFPFFEAIAEGRRKILYGGAFR